MKLPLVTPLGALSALAVGIGCVRLGWAFSIVAPRNEAVATYDSAPPITVDSPIPIPSPSPRNPFRTSGRAASLPLQEVAQSDDATIELPRLEVRAIAGGPPWRAIVLGRSGGGGPAQLLSEGEQFGEFLVARITTDTIVFRGRDTTLVFTMPRSVP